MDLRDTLGRPVRFCPKNTKEISHFKPEKNVENKKKFKKNFFSPQNVPLVVLTAGLKTLTNF